MRGFAGCGSPVVDENGELWNGPRAHFLCPEYLQKDDFDLRDAERSQEYFMRNEQLTELVAPAIADMGLECLGVEYSPSHGNSLVRIYIDASERAVTVDDCEAVSRQVSALFDVNDPIEGHYTLEVSSPGLDRPLYTPQQFARFIGQEVRLELDLPLDGRRRFQGPIRAVQGETVVIEQDGIEVSIAHRNVHKAKLVPEFAEKEKPGKGKKAEKAKK
jgi:ribosome maturation factor RimP